MQDLGKLILRLSIGGLMLFHGIAKLQDFEGTMDMMRPLLTEQGLPELLAYGVWVGEVLAPGLIIIGLFTRLSGLAVAATMGMAVFLAHQTDLVAADGTFPVLNSGGGLKLELQALYFFGGLAIACLGAGRLAIAPGRMRN